MSKNKSLSSADRVQVRLLSARARQLGEMVEKDCAWGLHTPRYTRERMEEGVLYIGLAETVLKGQRK